MENRITISICDEEYTFVAEEAPSYMQMPSPIAISEYPEKSK